MNICDAIYLGAFDWCDPIDLSNYAPFTLHNYVTHFECEFEEGYAEEIRLGAGDYYFESNGKTYKFNVQ